VIRGEADAKSRDLMQSASTGLAGTLSHEDEVPSGMSQLPERLAKSGHGRSSSVTKALLSICRLSPTALSKKTYRLREISSE